MLNEFIGTNRIETERIETHETKLLVPIDRAQQKKWKRKAHDLDFIGTNKIASIPTQTRQVSGNLSCIGTNRLM